MAAALFSSPRSYHGARPDPGRLMTETRRNPVVVPSGTILPPPAPPNRFAAGNPRLKPEKLWGVEAGYLGRPAEGFRLEAVVFYQNVDGLIGARQVNAIPSMSENVQSLDQVGVELGLQYAPMDKLSTYVNYAYVYSRDRETGDQVKDAIRGNLCRCGTYPHVVQAVLDASKRKVGA